MNSLYPHSRIVDVRVGDRVARVCVAATDGDEHTDSPHILFVHGNPGCLDDWADLAMTLNGCARIAAIDLPGFGRSEELSDGLPSQRLDASAAVIVGLLDAIGWSRACTVVAHSHGAAIAQALAAQHPERVAKLVLLSPLGLTPHAAYRALSAPGVGILAFLVAQVMRLAWCRRLMRPYLVRLVRRAFVPSQRPPEATAGYADAVLSRPSVVRSMVRAAAGHPCAQIERVVGSIQAPVLHIHGEADRLIAPALALRLHARRVRDCSAGGVRLQILQSAGHMLHMTHPDVVGRSICEFLGERPCAAPQAVGVANSLDLDIASSVRTIPADDWSRLSPNDDLLWQQAFFEVLERVPARAVDGGSSRARRVKGSRCRAGPRLGSRGRP